MCGTSLVWSAIARMQRSLPLWNYSRCGCSRCLQLVIKCCGGYEITSRYRETNKMYQCAKILSDQLNAISFSLVVFRGQQPTKHVRLQCQSFVFRSYPLLLLEHRSLSHLNPQERADLPMIISLSIYYDSAFLGFSFSVLKLPLQPGGVTVLVRGF